MQIGITFPTYEIGTDPQAIRAFVHAAEALGFEHIVAYEHVLGAGASRNEHRDGIVHGDYAYSRHLYHEPLVLFGFLAALTQLELATAVLILPQRQTALVAKQAAEVDVLSGGKLRLGIGTGWNIAEYEALGAQYRARGRMLDEQITLLRRLWQERFVTYDGSFHHIHDAGINPLPVQRPIPLWLGGSSDVALRRIARTGDGWFPLGQPTEQMRERVAHLRTFLVEAGRDAHAIGMEPRVNAQDGEGEEWVRQTLAWQQLGATHVSFNTLDAGYESLDQHVEAMHRFMTAVGSCTGTL